MQTGSLVFKEFVPKSETHPRSEKKRTRPKVPDSQRKRVRRACETCRHKREKCDGNVPCQRCSREKSLCTTGSASSNKRMSSTERLDSLQLVVQHALGLSSLDDQELRAVSESIRSTKAKAGDNSKVHTENSLSTFARQLEQKLNDTDPDEEEYGDSYEDPGNLTPADPIAEFCRSPSPVATPAKRFMDFTLSPAIPSKTTSEVLVRTCFEKVQCNSFYAQECWVQDHLSLLYTSSASLTERDVPVVATLFMIIALGAQFSSDPTLEHYGLVLYEQVTTVIPDLIRRSDFESIRACLLLATYLFPVDHSGNAYTYLGLALHIAMRNGMHRRCSKEVEVRVWWTLYTFYQRARIFHGHPKTLSHADVTVRRPQFVASLESAHAVSNFDNQVMLIEITLTLEEIADEISSLRKQRSALHKANLMALRRKLLHYHSLLPELEQSSSTGRLRLDIHLHLFYWHARLHLGRPFLLEHASANATTDHAPAGVLFAQDAVDAALAIIHLCQTIHEQIGLSRASYVTEFTSCRAALLVLIAKGITDKSTSLRDALAKGLVLIQQMSTGQDQASSETRVIVVMQRAINRLHACDRPTDTAWANRSHIAAQTQLEQQLREWELLWQQQSPESTSRDMHAFLEYGNTNDGLAYGPDCAVESANAISTCDPTSNDGYNTWNIMFSAQLDEFNSFPLGEYME